jgi:hypothetical protein
MGSGAGQRKHAHRVVRKSLRRDSSDEHAAAGSDGDDEEMTAKDEEGAETGDEVIVVRLTRREFKKWQNAIDLVDRVGWVLSGLERFAKWAAIMAGGAYVIKGMFPHWFGGPPPGGNP